jgi:hypothetical protein
MSDETSTTTTTSNTPEPVASATPAPQPGDSTSTTPAPETSATPEQQEARPDAQEEADKHTLPRGVQKRIDRLTRDKYRLQAELEVVRKQAPQPEPQQRPETGEPKADQFKSYEEYLDARAEWKAERRVEKRLGELRDNAQRQAGRAEQEKLQSQWEKRVSEALTTYDDFEEVALSPEVPISEPMMAAILRSPKGADVAYHLGKNHDLAAQIAALDPIGAAIRIGELAASLTRPTPKKTTGAPPPINPVGGRATTSTDPAQMTDAEFAKWRREQIKRRA